MDLIEAMQQRHTVRKYTDKKIPQEVLKLIQQRIDENNSSLSLSLKLVCSNKSGLNLIAKLFLGNGVRNFIILAGEDSKTLSENLGYAGADLMLAFQTWGLNSWLVGQTYNRHVSDFVPGKKVIGILAIGYGKTQGIPHKSKLFSDVATYQGKMPDWFIHGVNACLLAPTAQNKQDFRIEGIDHEVSIHCDDSIFMKENLGILKYHFELAAGKENFIWKE